MFHPYENYPLGNGKNKKSIPIRFDGNIDVDIVLGNPARNCQFYGICKINPTSNLEYDDFMKSETYLKNSLKAVLHLDMDKNLLIKFDCKTITAFIKNKYFKNDLFIISESIKIPGFVSSYFRTPYEIHKGVYPIEKGKDFYQITIKHL